MRITKTRGVLLVVIVAAAVFLGWRMVRPMNIFIITDEFALPISTEHMPENIESLSADGCAGCHQDFYDEWQTTIHSQAWTDPYFQVDFEFDGAQQNCLNCHIPLDNQQENLVTGFRDTDRWDPILEPNPDFDAELQQEGVTCTACHLRDGKLVGVLGTETDAHPVKTLSDPNQICVRCHVVSGERWDTFFKFPPCGTVAEIQATHKKEGGTGSSGEIVRSDTAALGCVECHMPKVERALVEGGPVRTVRRHLWRGGHDPSMVKGGLDVEFDELAADGKNRRFQLTITNTGAAHYLPTGTPDRHLVVSLRLLDGQGSVLDEQTHDIKRTIMWRPFIIDLWDTRLPRGEPRTYEYEIDADDLAAAQTVEASVEYFLVNEKRRKRIGYEGPDATHYEVFNKRVRLTQ